MPNTTMVYVAPNTTLVATPQCGGWSVSEEQHDDCEIAFITRDEESYVAELISGYLEYGHDLKSCLAAIAAAK